MPAHKDQHYVPRSYLAAWCDPDSPPHMEPYVWVFPKDSRVGRKKAPHNIFTESEMYTLVGRDGGRELGLEHLLADIESEFVRIRDTIIVPGKPLPALDNAKLRTFMALMQARTVRQRNHWQAQFGKLAEMGERMRARVQSMTPSERAQLPPPMPSSGPSMSMEQVEQLASNPIPMLVSGAIAHLVPQFLKMQLSILRTDTTPGFITSDAPCVIFDPEAHKRPFLYRAPGLVFPTVQVTMPIAPTHLACITHYGIDPPDPLPHTIVTELNRLTRGHSEQHFVVSRSTCEETWHDMGTPLEESGAPTS